MLAEESEVKAIFRVLDSGDVNLEMGGGVEPPPPFYSTVCGPAPSQPA